MGLSKKMLLTILTVFIVVFFLFMSLTIYGTILTSGPFKNGSVEGTSLGREIARKAVSGLEIAEDAGDRLMTTLKETLVITAPGGDQSYAQINQMLKRLKENGIDTGNDPAESRRIARTVIASDEFRTGDETQRAVMLIRALEQVTDGGEIVELNGKPERVAIFAPGEESNAAKRMTEWCSYCKYPYRVFHTLPEAFQLRGYDMLLMASWPEEEEAVSVLRQITRRGIVLICAEMPGAAEMAAQPELMELFGIEQIRAESMEVDKIHLFGDFYLSSERIYEKDDYYGETDDMILNIPYYHLRPGYEVYAVAELSDENGVPLSAEEMPPLIWRTVTDRSRVFCMCTDIFAGNALTGTLSAFAAEATNLYVYPVVNAQTVNLLSFPYMSRENDEELSRIYGHQADTLTGSVLWPAVIQSAYVYSQFSDYYVSASLDYTQDVVAADMMAGYFTRQIQKQLGMMALTLKQHSNEPLEKLLDRNAAFVRQYAPEWKFSTVYTGAFTAQELAPYLKDSESLLGQTTLLMQEPTDELPMVSATEDGVMQIQLTTYGFCHEARDDLNMLATQTALAMDNQYIDMDRVMYPASDSDYWNRLSTIWSSGVTFYHDFKRFDYVQTPELAERAANFLTMDYRYERQEDGIHIHVQGIPEGKEAYLILRLQGTKPEGIRGGTLEQLTDTSYLIRIDENGKEIFIGEKPMNRLNMP